MHADPTKGSQGIAVTHRLEWVTNKHTICGRSGRKEGRKLFKQASFWHCLPASGERLKASENKGHNEHHNPQKHTHPKLGPDRQKPWLLFGLILQLNYSPGEVFSLLSVLKNSIGCLSHAGTIATQPLALTSCGKKYKKNWTQNHTHTLTPQCVECDLGPLPTWAKSHDREIVSARKKVSKGRSNAPPKSCSVVTDSQVSCEVTRDQALNHIVYQWIAIHAGPHTWCNRINQHLWAFGVPWSPNFVLGLPPRGGFWKQSKWPWNMIH